MKKTALYLMMVAFGIFLNVSVALTDTFDPSRVVHVSGDCNGLLYFRSDHPEALNTIQGATQFRNDTMKRNGTGRNRNAQLEAVRVNPNLLTIQLYQATLEKQFAFNVRNGALWGQIPSCNLIPDGKTVIIEDSYPINASEKKDSENGEGGHHFSLVAHLEGGAKSKLVNPIPFDPGTCGGGHGKAFTSKKKTSHYHKGKSGKWDSCDQDPCVLLNSIKEDTTVIRADVKEIKVDVKEIKTDVKDVKSSVGMPDPNEPADEKTLQQKARKTLDSVGVADKSDEADEKTIQQKTRKTLKKVKHIKKVLGESKRKGGTVAGVLDENHKDIKYIRELSEKMAAKQGITVKELTCNDCHKPTGK